ncbi:MAG TPA: threonylcarbamoyl-AMP synthase [Bacteroidetes bacterium]|nr:threonylcarbamoyl-AMP synthase [Bacteroidota bacterium]
MEDNFKNIIDLLDQGKVILYPTDTIWGLGCDALNTGAIKKIYKIKQRELNKPFIVLVSSIEMLKEYIQDIHPRVETLLLYHKRPLTLIYPKGKNLPSILMKNKKIAIRIIKEPVIAELIEKFGRPIVSTSANIAGADFPKSYNEINKEIIEAVDYTFKYKQNDPHPGSPSVIATYNKKGKLKFLR